jgi:hypothetical protein
MIYHAISVGREKEKREDKDIQRYYCLLSFKIDNFGLNLCVLCVFAVS